MFNVFALVLMVCTFFSGIFWCIKYFNKSNFLQCKFNRIFLLCGFCSRWKVFLCINKICCYCANWIFNFCVSVFPILFFVFIIRSFLFEPFQIPSGSMMPTLLSGDFILVNKFCYGIKNPVTQSTLIGIGKPKRGDVVVFKYPLNMKLDYVKRVVGVPGDRVIYNSFSKQLVIYPKYSMKDNNYTDKPVSITYTDVFLSNFVQIFNFDNGEIISNFSHLSVDKSINNGIRLTQSSESFDGVIHKILTIVPPGTYDFSIQTYDTGQFNEFVSEWIVPVGKYFMLGDNRDNSSDSRYWGFVPEKNLVGKVVVIWFSFEKKQDGGLPIIVRFNRFGKIC